MASRKEYEMLFKLSAQLGAQFSGTFKNARSEITSMQNELQALKKTQGDISAYQKQQTALENSRRKLEVLQKEYANIQREMDETGTYSSALENRLLNKQLQIEKTSAAVDTYERKVDQMGEALRSAGVDTDNLTQESKRLATEIEGVKTKQQGVIDSLDEGGSSARFFGDESVAAVEGVQQALVAAGLAQLFREIGEAMVECAEESIEFESAITGVYKTVDGSEEQLAAIRSDIKELATDIPATTEEISAVAEAAGQLGIATDNVMTFTGVMIDLGESTNLSAEEAASSLAKFTNITGTVATEYSRLGSVIVDLGNNYATTEADIVAMSTRLASAGTLAGLTEPEIMALAAAMSSVGIEAEAGGTAMTQTFSAIEKAVAEGGDNLSEFARISGMSAGEFATAWETSPITAIQAFIAGIGSLEDRGESAVLVLDELGLSGIRQSNMLKSLGLAADTLTGAVSTANNAWEENIALSAEADKRYATTESKLAMLGNSYDNLQAAIGDVYTPTVREAAEVGMVMLDGLTTFVENNPAVVKALTALAIGVGAFVAALGGYIVVSKLAKVATTALTAAVAANPLLMGASIAIGAVAALAAGFVALTSAEDEHVKEIRELSEASRQQYNEIQDLKAEYEEACDVYGETSDEARYLAWEIDELTDSFENNKQSLDEYIEECQNLNDSLNDVLDTNREAYQEIGDNEGTTLALVHRLQDLASQTDKTVATQEEMKAIIDELNQVVPELSLSYEDVTSGVADFGEAIETAVKSQAAMERYEAAQQGMVDALNAQYDAQAKLNELYDQRDSAQERANAAEQEYLDYLAMTTRYDTTGGAALAALFSSQKKEYDAASDALTAYDDQIAELEATLATATSDYEEYKEALVGFVEETYGGEEAAIALNTAIAGTIAQVEELAAAYTEAYTAAYESISGQYALWDEAATVAATSAADINTALQSQATYWQDYNANLASLTERSADIEGLSEVIASFADGSADSVNAIAGLAAASDEDLTAMVENWKTVQAEQEAAAGAIADLKTDFTATMDELQTELAADIEAMNLSEDAAESGRATVQGFIDSAYSMLPQVQAAYAQVAQTAADAINTTLDIHSPSRVTGWAGNMAVEGFIQPAEKMEGDAAQAYSNLGDAGATALAEEVQMVTMAPQLMAALMATRAAPAYAATPASGGVPGISLQVEYNISSPGGEDLTRQLDQSAQNLRDLVRQTVEDMMDDQNRGAYR